MRRLDSLLPLGLPAALLLLLGIAAPGVAQSGSPVPTTPSTLPVDPAVRTGTLSNGLRYYVRENREPRGRAELRLVVDAGSIQEDDDQLGIAHFVEHMAFNGTRRFEKQALVRYLESIGMKFGPDVNAYTSFDETVYMLTVPTDSARFLETGLEILEDWAHGVTLDSAEIEKERGVVTEEWRLGRGAWARIRDQQTPVVFRGSRYAERNVIGTRESLAAATPEVLRRFYRDWYRPDLMAVVVVGDVEAERVIAMIEQRFGGIAPAAAPRPRETVTIPGHRETLVAIATDPEATSTSVAILHKQPRTETATQADYRREIVERLYNGMLTDRFSELTRETDPPVIGAGSWQGAWVRGGGVYQLGAQVPESGILRGLETLLTESERVARHGFTATELERQKTKLLRRLEEAHAERDKTPSHRYAAEYVRHFLTSEPILAVEQELALHREALPGIGLEEVNRLARAWATDHDRVVLVSAPETATTQVPSEAELLAAFDRVRAREISAYEDRVSDAPLVAQLPPRGRVVAEKRIEEAGVTEWTLSNGARVLLKPTDFKDDEVLFRAYSPGGSSLVADEDSREAGFAGMLVAESGLGSFDATTLKKRLADRATQLWSYVGDRSEGMRGRASTRDLEILLQLAHLHFTAPREDSAAAEALRTRFRAMAAQWSLSPERVFRDTLQVTLTRSHPRALPFTAATVDSLDLGRAIDLYRERFAAGGDFTFVFVGRFEEDSLRDLTERYLASLPAAERRETPRDLGIEPPEGVVRKVVRKGLEPKSRVSLVLHGPFEYSRQNLALLDAVAGVLRTRLRDDLREEQGGTYGVAVSQGATHEPRQRYRLQVEFGAAPERVEELTRRVLFHLDSLRAVPPTADEVAKLREQSRRAQETRLRENEHWLGKIHFYDERGWPLGEIPREGERAERIDADALHRAARRYLGTPNQVQVTLLPASAAP